MARRRLILLLIEILLVAAVAGGGLALRLRIARGWVYAGRDTYGYLAIAGELRTHGRYALAPEPEPLTWGRPPVYPLAVAAVAMEPERAWYHDKALHPNWARIQYLQIVIDVLGTGLCAWWLARRLAGRGAGLLAFALVCACPFTALFTSAILTETLATFFTTAALVALAATGMVRRHPLAWPVAWISGGVALGLGVLVRSDTILLAPAFAVCALVPAASSTLRARLVGLGLALSAFGVSVLPWAARNMIQFGAPHVIIGRLDRDSRPMHHADGFHRWLATWARSDAELRKYEWNFYDPKHFMNLSEFTPDVFYDIGERRAVSGLLMRRNRDGVAGAVSEGFDALAARRRTVDPWQVLVALPFERAIALWVNPHDDVLVNPMWQPWPTVTARARPHARDVAKWMTIAWVLAGMVLLAIGRTRHAAAVLVAGIVVRTAALAFFYYPEPRYVLEVMPAALILVGVAPFALGDWVLRLWRARAKSRLTATSPAPR